MQPLLKVSDLKKYFSMSSGMLHAVDGVSFSLNAGDTLGVVGESGCGKSTLGRVILHLLEANGGKIIFNGEDVSTPDKKRLKELRRDMQMIFQDPYASIDPRMSVSEIICEPLKLYKVASTKKEYQHLVQEIMDTVGLARRLENAYPHELDGGRRQRVGIGRALALGPKFIICDEPVSALDVSIQAQVLNLMQDLQQEKDLTYIFITHDLAVVRHISTNIMVMYLGVCVEMASVDDLFRRQFHPYTQALLSAIPSINPQKRKERIIMKGELASPIDPPDACRFAPRCRFVTESCLAGAPKLEEIESDHFVACKRVSEIT